MKMEIAHERRPCVIAGRDNSPERKAFFHRWADQATPVDPSPFVGGNPGGQYWCVQGIVEYEDGSIDRVPPERITFLDVPQQNHE